MDWFHSFNCILLLGVLVFVVFLFIYLFRGVYYLKKSGTDYRFIELMCSVFPSLILIIQMLPSLRLLYYYGLMSIDRFLTVKIVAHQWYWSYSYRDIEGLEYDSYIKSLDQLNLGEYRLLEVDNRCILPIGVNIRFCITSADVIHAWSLSNISIKLDAMRGILSTICYSFPLIGVFYGQCSEICGVNHRFIPVVVEVTLVRNFKSWCLRFFDDIK